MSISEVRLAGRRRARDPEDLALRHGEGLVVHGHGIAVALVHVRYFDDRAIPPAALPVLRGRGSAASHRLVLASVRILRLAVIAGRPHRSSGGTSPRAAAIGS